MQCLQMDIRNAFQSNQNITGAFNLLSVNAFNLGRCMGNSTIFINSSTSNKSL